MRRKAAQETRLRSTRQGPMETSEKVLVRDSHFPKRLTTSRGVEELLLSCLFVCIYVRWLVSLSLSPAMGRAGSARHHTFISHLAERLASCNTNANGATALAVRIGSCLVSRRSRLDFYLPPSTFPSSTLARRWQGSWLS